MWVRFGVKRKLLYHVAADQVVAATSINDHAARTLFDDTFCLEQRVPLILLRFLHLCTQYALHNETLRTLRILSTNMLFWFSLTTCMVSCKHSICIFIGITTR